MVNEEKPDLSNLREFGCTVYVLIVWNKLDLKVEEGKFVGYDDKSKGFCIY